MSTSVYCSDQTRPAEVVLDFFNQMKWSLSSTASGEAQLVFAKGQLKWRNPKLKIKPLGIDFIAEWKRLSIGKQDVFAKAIGVRLGVANVVDATAGLGGDSVKLLKLGCQVVAIEQSPILFALLLDAKIRAEENSLWLERVSPRFQLLFGPSEKILADLSPDQREVIYLDPMFPEREKSALSKGEMQHLQSLLGDPLPIEGLHDLAYGLSGRRLVLKRPRHAQALELVADQEFVGQSVRYDVWLRK